MIPYGFGIGLVIGVSLFFAVRIAVEALIWRLRGRPPCGLHWPLNWRNLLDDGWRKQKLENGKIGWYRETPRWK